MVECRIFNREVAGSNLSLGYFAPRSTQPSIPPGSVNPLKTCAIPERFCGGDSLLRGAISSVCTFCSVGAKSVANFRHGFLALLNTAYLAATLQPNCQCITYQKRDNVVWIQDSVVNHITSRKNAQHVLFLKAWRAFVYHITYGRSQWSSGSMLDCSARGPGIESRCGQLCLSDRTPTAIYSLGHGLCAPFLQCLGQLSLLPSVRR